MSKWESVAKASVNKIWEQTKRQAKQVDPEGEYSVDDELLEVSRLFFIIGAEFAESFLESKQKGDVH